MNAILEDKKGILQTHSLRWLIYLWDCLGRNLFVGEILYGIIESILSRLLLSNIPGSWRLLVLLIISLGNPTWLHCFLRYPHSWCKTKKNKLIKSIMTTMAGLVLFWLQWKIWYYFELYQ
jgi:hypothetical protein